MYEIRVEPIFKADYKRVAKAHPHIAGELRAAIGELAAHGTVPASYRPHVLDSPGGNYNGHVDFHLSDGEVDVIVLYMPHKTNPVIRLVRMGAHRELFQGSLR